MDNRLGETASHDLDACSGSAWSPRLSDEQLLERFAAQVESDSEIAFEAIVSAMGPWCWGCAADCWATTTTPKTLFRLPSSCWRSSSAVRKGQSLGPWLHGVAARICQRARLVGRRRQQQPIPTGGLIDQHGHDPALADLNRVLDEELRGCRTSTGCRSSSAIWKADRKKRPRESSGGPREQFREGSLRQRSAAAPVDSPWSGPGGGVAMSLTQKRPPPRSVRRSWRRRFNGDSGELFRPENRIDDRRSGEPGVAGREGTLVWRVVGWLPW